MTSDRMEFVLELVKMLSIVICVLAVCGTIVAGIAFGRSPTGGARTFSLLFQRAGAIQLLTVVVIVMSVLILRLLDALSAEAAVGMFGGVAGYVLGNLG